MARGLVRSPKAMPDRVNVRFSYSAKDADVREWVWNQRLGAVAEMASEYVAAVARGEVVPGYWKHDLVSDAEAPARGAGHAEHPIKPVHREPGAYDGAGGDLPAATGATLTRPAVDARTPAFPAKVAASTGAGEMPGGGRTAEPAAAPAAQAEAPPAVAQVEAMPVVPVPVPPAAPVVVVPAAPAAMPLPAESERAGAAQATSTPAERPEPVAAATQAPAAAPAPSSEPASTAPAAVMAERDHQAGEPAGLKVDAASPSAPLADSGTSGEGGMKRADVKRIIQQARNWQKQ
ncbi:hypothetical protein AB7849_15225 [Rhodanobacter sp. 115]|uniref:hypothetical protein n=1 Tax=Rhodanobacter sp. FW021-MT20 TaxID=1162282 RepID=UPI0034E44A73